MAQNEDAGANAHNVGVCQFARNACQIYCDIYHQQGTNTMQTYVCATQLVSSICLQLLRTLMTTRDARSRTHEKKLATSHILKRLCREKEGKRRKKQISININKII